MQISVPQKDGTITLTQSGRAPRTFDVHDHAAEVDDSDVELFLSAVEGSRVTDAASEDKSSNQPLNEAKPGASGTPAKPA